MTATYVVEAMAAANAYQRYLDASDDNKVLYSNEESDPVNEGENVCYQ